MKAIAVLFAIVAVASATPIDNKNLITDIIKGIIENNKDKLANITVANIETDKGTVSNLNILGADQLVIERLDATGPLAVDIANATVTLAQATGTADFNLTDVVIEEIGLALTGAGQASATITDLFLTVALDLSLDGLTPVLEDFSDLDISVGSINAQLTGLEDPSQQDIINNDLAGWLSANLARIANLPENKPLIISKINEVLGGL